MGEKPNIIVCMCDQLRAFETGCYGNSVVRTPNIDRLASEGIRFETAVTNFPVCMAARSVFLSGQYNRTCTGGVTNVHYRDPAGGADMPEYPYPGRLHLKAPTLPELLREAGYYNATIGKWHIHTWPHEAGFDYYLIPRVHHCHTGQSYTENGGPEFIAPGYSVEFEAERVQSFLETRGKKGGPFFLFYNISPPHCPTADSPEKYLNMYKPEMIPLRPNVNPDKPLDRQDHWFKIYRWDFQYYKHHLPYTENLPEGYSLRHLIAEYYGLTTWMDAALGRMLASLDSTGLAGNTIVVFTSDHGDNLGSHGLVQKSSPNDEAIRIPLIARGPMPACPRVNRKYVASLVDLMPSLLELAGVPVPSHVQGRSLAPILNGTREWLADNRAFFETSGGAGIRSPTHMYYLPFDEALRAEARSFSAESVVAKPAFIPRTEGLGSPAKTDEGTRVLSRTPRDFFDLAADPYELNNLACKSASDPIARELDSLIRKWDKSIPWMT